jgi:hypothetical protein
MSTGLLSPARKPVHTRAMFMSPRPVIAALLLTGLATGCCLPPMACA